jgi:hypothetical protein
VTCSSYNKSKNAVPSVTSILFLLRLRILFLLAVSILLLLHCLSASRFSFLEVSKKYHTLQRKSHLCIPFLDIARPQSQFPHSCVCERFIGSGHIFPAAEYADRSWEYINCSQTLGLCPRNFFSGNICFQIFSIGS